MNGADFTFITFLLLILGGALLVICYAIAEISRQDGIDPWEITPQNILGIISGICGIGIYVSIIFIALNALFKYPLCK